MVIFTPRPLHIAGPQALRRHIFGVLPYDPALLLAPRDACEAVARTQTFLSEYVHTLFGMYPAYEAEARARLGVAQEALAEVWASMPAGGITASDLEAAVIAACSTTHVEAA